MTKFYHKQSAAFLILPCLKKIEWWISRIFMDLSNQLTQFLPGFKHMKIWWVFFLLICLFKWQQIELDLIFRNSLLKSFILISLILTLSQIIFVSSSALNCTQKFFLGELFMPENVWTQFNNLLLQLVSMIKVQLKVV